MATPLASSRSRCPYSTPEREAGSSSASVLISLTGRLHKPTAQPGGILALFAPFWSSRV